MDIKKYFGEMVSKKLWSQLLQNSEFLVRLIKYVLLSKDVLERSVSSE
jgi:hypothetical protein